MSDFSTPPVLGSANIGTGAVTTTGILDGTIANADVSTSAAIALSKLATVTASRALVSGTDGLIAPAAATTLTEIGYVNGVTSAIQTQLGTKAPIASPTFTGTATTPLLVVANTGNTAGLALGVAGATDGVLTAAESLHVCFDSDNSQTDRFFAIDHDAVGTELFRVQENGRVGIANAAPATLLEVGAAADTSGVNVRINGSVRTGANVGTFTNSPHTGNPTTYLDIIVNGTTYCIPCFATS